MQVHAPLISTENKPAETFLKSALSRECEHQPTEQVWLSTGNPDLHRESVNLRVLYPTKGSIPMKQAAAIRG
jgi:hypothetical protein